MAHAVHLADDAYRALEKLAREREQAPAAVIERLIEEADTRSRTAYETEDRFRHLGATEEQIRESARLAVLDKKEESTESLDYGE